MRPGFPISVTGTVAERRPCASAICISRVRDMSESQIGQDILAACQTAAEEVGNVLTAALDRPIALEPGEATPFDENNPPDGLSGAGLAVMWISGEAGGVLLLPESTGLLPDWYAEPDATGESKLATLAQELGMNVLPEQFMPDGFRAERVADVAESLRRTEVASDAAVVELKLSSEAQQGAATLIWPVAKPAELFDASEESASSTEEPSTDDAPAEPAKPEAAGEAKQPTADGADIATVRHRLPSYSRSLLKVKVPVLVTLAATKRPIDEITRLGPGSIIQFDKACDETLDLSVANQRVAVGEAVKVGEKFGLRITSIVMPDERFETVRSRRA